MRPAQRYDDFQSVKFKKPAKLIAGVTSSRVLPRHITVPFGAEAPSGHVAYGLSNPTSLLGPALPMAPTTDDKVRDKQSVVRLNPATF